MPGPGEVPGRGVPAPGGPGMGGCMAFWFGGLLVESGPLLWPSGVIFC